MANVGDKYIIEIGEVLPCDNRNVKKLYRINGFRSLVFDDDGLEKLQKYEDPAEFQIGDEVISGTSHKFIITRVGEDFLEGFSLLSGHVYTSYKDKCCKTGRHLEWELS